MINGGIFIVTIVETVWERRLRSANLPLTNNSARLNCFNEGLPHNFKRAILRVSHHRIQIYALLRMGDGKGQPYVTNDEDRMDRILRAISNLFRQDSGAFLGNFHANAVMDNTRRSNKQHGIKVLLGKRNRRSSSTRGSGHGKSSYQGGKTFCGDSGVRVLSIGGCRSFILN